MMKNIHSSRSYACYKARAMLVGIFFVMTYSIKYDILMIYGYCRKGVYVKEVVIRSYYKCRPGRVTVDFKKPSMTQQQFRDECDINYIMSKFRDTGFLVDPLKQRTARPQFGDFSTAADFMEAQNIIVRARENFEALPSHVRQEFGNDPARMLSFLENESNYQRAVELGLVEKRPDPPSEPPAQQVSSEGTAP